jgi:hypothetical protein
MMSLITRRDEAGGDMLHGEGNLLGGGIIRSPFYDRDSNLPAGGRMRLRKTLASITMALLLAAPAAIAGDKFSLPDLTIEPAKPSHTTPAKPSPAPLTAPKSQWSGDNGGKPAKSFGDLSNDFCDGCKLSVKARQAPLYRNLGPTPLAEPDEPFASDDDE